MNRFSLREQLTAPVVIFALLALFLPTSPAVAGWVSTRTAVEGPKARLVSLLNRQDLSRALQQLGVDPGEAARRVEGLTDEEARAAVQRLDALPAGGSAAVALISAALLVFVILLLTDLLGFTDVFPFVKKTVR